MSNLKIILVTDNFVGSSAEDFVLMLKVLPQVTIIGDKTRGNPGGAPNARELPNGWIYYMSTSVQYSMENKTLYDGISPKILVKGNLPGKDLMIEKAIELLNSN